MVMLTWFVRDPTPVLTGPRTVLRAPRSRDYEAWRALRKKSRDFLKPFEGHNITTFALNGAGENTNVVWSMDGPTPFVSKVMQVFMSMDAMIGKDFEKGLANLKAAAE